MLENSIPIHEASVVQKAVKDSHDIDIDLHNVRHILKKDLGLSYRIAKKVPI